MKKTVHDILQERRKRAFRLRDRRRALLLDRYPAYAALDREKKEAGAQFMQAGFAGKLKEAESYKNRLQELEKKEKSFFKQLGKGEDYLAPAFFCKDCQDKGFVNGKSCHCRKQLMVEQAYDMSSIRQKLEEQNFQHFDLGLFRRDRQAGEPLSPRENMAEIKHILENAYVSSFGRKVRNLYIYGATGVGKTYLVNCYAKAILDRGYTVLYQTASELFRFLIDYSFMYREEKREYEDRRAFCDSADLLIIDDLGTEFINEKTLVEFFDLLNGRLVHNKATVISSNVQPLELKSLYDERIASRITGDFVPIYLFGSDLRQQMD